MKPESLILQTKIMAALQKRLDGRGSTMFSMTWNLSVTPALRSVFRLAASARPMLGNDFTSWPSPVAQPANGTPEAFLQRKRNAVAKGSSMGICLSDIAMVAQLTGWPSPTTPSGGQTVPEGTTAEGRTPDGRKVQVTLKDVENLAGWLTPRTPTGGPESAERKKELGRMKAGGGDLQAAAQMASWATPRAQELCQHNSADNGMALSAQAQLTASGPTPSGSPAQTEKRGQLNPELPRWLQGLPPEWCDCAVTAIQSSPRKRKLSSKPT